MTEGLEQELKEAQQAVEEASSMVHAQEAKVLSMRLAGLNTQHAEALLAAYRDGVRFATEHRKALEELARLRWRPR